MYFKYFNMLIVVVAATFYSCTPTLNTPSNPAKQLPKSYSGKSDTSNSAATTWRNYFSDTTLQTLIDTALKNNYNMLIALQRVEASRANVILSKATRAPQVSAAGAASVNKYGLYTMDGAGNIDVPIYNGEIIPNRLPNYFLGIQTNWEVDIWGKLRNRKRAAVARFLSTEEGRNLVQTNLIADIAYLYYQLLALDNEMEVIQETIGLQERALEIVKIQKKAGAANELGVEQFSTQLLNSMAMEKETRQRIIETETQLNYLLGRYPQKIQRDKDFINVREPFKIEVGIPSQLLLNRPDIKQAELELVAAKADVKAARAAFFPTLNLNGTYGLQAFRTNLLLSPESIAYSLLGGISAPILNRRAIKADFYFSGAREQEAYYNYHQTVLNAYAEVFAQQASIENLQDIKEIKINQVDIATKSIETSTKLFTTGNATYLEVLLAQKNVLDSRLELVDTSKRQYIAFVNMYKALGGGWK